MKIEIDVKELATLLDYLNIKSDAAKFILQNGIE